MSVGGVLPLGVWVYAAYRIAASFSERCAGKLHWRRELREALEQAREARERSGGNGDGWCSRGRMFLEGGVSDRRRSDRWRLSAAGGGAASLLTCPYRMRAAPDCGRGERAAAREGSLLFFLHPKRAVFSPSPEDTRADQLMPAESLCIMSMDKFMHGSFHLFAPYNEGRGGGAIQSWELWYPSISQRSVAEVD